ncbi:Clp protease N-terminal domain-containing protein [Nonomuraea sp. NPDC049714]|uniref:Clp protease N-terminal domain-containing protein n=1 Tax=Nonomuraea sp. NPDC049714 TaxID=3364357 RepID=UPI003792CA8E
MLKSLRKLSLRKLSLRKLSLRKLSLRKTIHYQPLENFLTVRARKVLSLAAKEASARGHDRVTAGHLLEGLARLNDGVAVMTLSSLGIDVDVTRSRAAGADLSRITDLARQEAAELGHRYIGTEHLLLGLIHEDAEVFGVSLQQARAQVIKVLHGDAP